MFMALKPLLAQCNSLTFIIANQGDDITVTVMPKIKEGQDRALAQPLQLTGTAQELDDGLPLAILAYSGKRLTLTEQVEATNAILEAARQSSAEKSSKALKRPSSASKPSPASSTVATDDVSNDGDDNEVSSSAISSPVSDTTASCADGGLENIFG